MSFSIKSIRSGLLLIAAVGLILPGTAFSGNGDLNRTKQASQFTNEDTESAKGAVVVSSGTLEMSALKRKIHEARMAGNEETVRMLESMTPGQPAGGESAGATILRTSRSVAGPGSLRAADGPTTGPSSAGETLSRAAFGTDIHPRTANAPSWEWNQAMASDSSGNLYLAWQDDALGNNYIQIYDSSDGGETWAAYGYVSNPSAHLREPSIAVGEGTEDVLLLAYIVDDGSTIPYPEVATTPLGLWSFTFHSVPYWSFWEGFAKPVIWTDAYTYPGWYAYLTCEGIYDAAAGNINVCSFRSIDYGATWGDELVALGNADSDAWIDPDGTFGTLQYDAFIVCFNDTYDTLNCISSTDFGVTYSAPTTMCTMSEAPIHPVDPEIEAAKAYNNVMVCCTKAYSGDDNIGQIYSTDAGASWSTFWNLDGSDYANHEFAPALIACEGGGSWHLAFTKSHQVYYSKRPQDLSAYWPPSTDLVSDVNWASHDYPKKAIACNWTTDEPGIAWADYRDGFFDYDTYFDHADNGIDPLATSSGAVWESSGGSVQFTLTAGPGNANRNYIILGSVTGTSPGFPLPGGYVTLPLNWDVFTDFGLEFINTPVFSNFLGKLNGNGDALALLQTGPLPPGVAGVVMHYAYCMNNPFNFVSNPVEITINP